MGTRSRYPAGWPGGTPNPVIAAQSIPSLSLSFALVPAGLSPCCGRQRWSRVQRPGPAAAARLLGPPLTQRVRDLEETRASAVDDSAARLRRIERNLHDGAQAQMVAVAMKLGRRRRSSATRPAVRPRAGRSGGGGGVDLARALTARRRPPRRQGGHHRAARPGPGHPPCLHMAWAPRSRPWARAAWSSGRGDRRPAGVPVSLDRDHRALCAAELLATWPSTAARGARLEAVHVPGLLRCGSRRRQRRRAGPGGRAGRAHRRLRTVDGTSQIRARVAALRWTPSKCGHTPDESR